VRTSKRAPWRRRISPTAKLLGRCPDDAYCHPEVIGDLRRSNTALQP